MESYLRYDGGVSQYEVGLANPEQVLNISHEGNLYEHLIDFSKIGGLDLSSYGFTGLTPSNSGGYVGISPTPSVAYNNPYEVNASNIASTPTICPQYLPDLLTQSTSIKQPQTNHDPFSSNLPDLKTNSQQLIYQNMKQESQMELSSPTPTQSSLLGSRNNTIVDYFDVTPYIQLSQEKAAKKLGIPKSTLSKRWREATCNRKWPYRQLCKLDREIKTLIQNMRTNGNAEPHMRESLAALVKMREEESKVVYIKNMGSTIRSDSGNSMEISSVKSSPSQVRNEVPSGSSTTLWPQLQTSLANELMKNLKMPNL